VRDGYIDVGVHEGDRYFVEDADERGPAPPDAYSEEHSVDGKRVKLAVQRP
jgi:hypothetical protein